MNLTRLVVLGLLMEHGPRHGHQLRRDVQVPRPTSGPASAPVRAGICSTLERAAIGVLCETADHRAVARLATLQEVDAIVLNNPLPGQGAADALRAMPTRRPIKLVALLGPHEQSHPLALLRSEVRGLVNADGMPNELIRAVRCVVDGGLYSGRALRLLTRGSLAPIGHHGIAPRTDVTLDESIPVLSFADQLHDRLHQ